MAEIKVFSVWSRDGAIDEGLPAEVQKLLDQRFFSESECNKWFLDRFYIYGPECSHCRERLDDDQHAAFYALRRFDCRKCGRKSNALRNTLLHHSRVTPRQLFIVAALAGYGFSNREIGRVARLDQSTVWKLKERFQALTEVES